MQASNPYANMLTDIQADALLDEDRKRYGRDSVFSDNENYSFKTARVDRESISIL